MTQPSRSADNKLVPALELVRGTGKDDAVVGTIRRREPAKIVKLPQVEADEFYANPPCTD
jgi:hypothetical protein